MKKILTLLALAFCLNGKAQCSITASVSPTAVCAGGTGLVNLSATSGFSSYTWMPGGYHTPNLYLSITSLSVTTIYTVSATTGTCTTSNTIAVIVNPIPTANFIGSDTVDCSPLSVSFTDLSTISSGSITAWHWTFGNGSNSTFQSPGQSYINTSTVNPAYYNISLTVTSNKGCINTITRPGYIEVLPCTTSGIEQLANINELNIYPNPNNGLFNLTMSQFDNLKMNHIEIYNVTGDCVHRQIATSANCQIDISNLNEGVYNISLQSTEGLVNKRVVIVR